MLYRSRWLLGALALLATATSIQAQTADTPCCCSCFADCAKICQTYQGIVRGLQQIATRELLQTAQLCYRHGQLSPAHCLASAALVINPSCNDARYFSELVSLRLSLTATAARPTPAVPSTYPTLRIGSGERSNLFEVQATCVQASPPAPVGLCAKSATVAAQCCPVSAACCCSGVVSATAKVACQCKSGECCKDGCKCQPASPVRAPVATPQVIVVVVPGNCNAPVPIIQHYPVPPQYTPTYRFAPPVPPSVLPQPKPTVELPPQPGYYGPPPHCFMPPPGYAPHMIGLPPPPVPPFMPMHEIMHMPPFGVPGLHVPPMPSAAPSSWLPPGMRTNHGQLPRAEFLPLPPCLLGQLPPSPTPHCALTEVFAVPAPQPPCVGTYGCTTVSPVWNWVQEIQHFWQSNAPRSEEPSSAPAHAVDPAESTGTAPRQQVLPLDVFEAEECSGTDACTERIASKFSVRRQRANRGATEDSKDDGDYKDSLGQARGLDKLRLYLPGWPARR